VKSFILANLNKKNQMRGCLFIKNVILLIFCLSINLNTYPKSTTDDIQGQIEQSKSQIEKYEKEGNKIELAKNLTRIGNLYWQVDAQTEAIKYFERSVAINIELGNKNALKVIYNYLGAIYFETNDYQKAISYFEKSLKINIDSKNFNETASDYLNLARALQSLGYYAESNERAKKGLEKALELDNLNMVKSYYSLLGENYDKLGQSKTSGEYFDKYNTISKHLQKQQMEAMENKTQEIEKQVQTKEKQLKSTLDTLGEVLQVNREMQLQNELLNKENQLKEMEVREQEARMEAREKVRHTQIVSLSVVLLLFISIFVLIYWQFQQKKKANILLKKQNIEIDRQKTEIEHQHNLVTNQTKKITDSIQYARRIQRAVLPPEEIFKEGFNDYFVLYRPKDIVSGDFYWVTKKDDILIVAVADCTGHGVPGAFMSMLGVAYLNEIVNKIAINKHISSLNADDILNQLREMVISSLHQTGNMQEPRDGMDIALCIIDYEHKKLQYAGANNPLYLVRNGELIVYKADAMPVSYHQYRNVSFKKHVIDLLNDDRIYLFSDGFVDQFGGEKGMKFLSNRFRDLIISIHKQSMSDQCRIIEKALDDWKGDRPQLDDVLVIGTRFSKKISAEKSISQINWQSKTILIAEDTDVNYFLMVEVLKHTKVKVFRVKDGKEAFDFVKNNDVDLILMDINMPRMNGYEATKSIKELRNNIPIIVQTAMNFDDSSEEAIKSGADDYISKPIDLKTFISKIERFLS
jgi:CheY-like chemotaxis protein